VFLSVVFLHVTLGKTINPKLQGNGFFPASPEYKEASYPVIIRDNVRYYINYNRGVPQLDMCKPAESGSPWFYWPLGARSVRYAMKPYPDGKYGYLFFQANPAVWWLGALAVVTAFALVTCSYLFRIKLKQRFMLSSLLFLYSGYLFGISRIDRVMYINHYLPPLVVSFVLFALVFGEIKTIGSWKLTKRRKHTLMLLIALGIFLSFQFYRPLNTMSPMTDAQLKRRAILPIWNLQCSNCPRSDPMFEPRDCKKSSIPSTY